MDKDQELEQKINLAADALAARLTAQFAETVQAQLNSHFQRQALTLPKGVTLTPYQIDLAKHPVLHLGRVKLLNFQPDKYFGTSVPWPAPAYADIPRFLDQLGLSAFSTLSRELRVLPDGTAYVKSASNLWFKIFGIRFNFQRLNQPLKIGNTPRFEESPNADPHLFQFLELLQ